MTPEPLVIINTRDAASRGIVDGSQVYVESPRGRVKFRAKVTEDIVGGAVEAYQGGGGPIGPKAWQESNVNELTDLTRYDPISGFPIYKTLLCEVTPVEGGDVVRHAESDDHESDARRASRGALKPTREVYLDHNASTSVHPEVLDVMIPYLKESDGNPSSIHSKGNVSHEAVEGARRKVARALNCTARRIVFTGGGSEADNLAIKGAARSHCDRGNHIITTAIEHPAVLNTCKALEKEGFETTVLPVDRHGLVDTREFARAIRPETILATVMMANNEIGTLQPIAKLAAIAHERGVLFHTDAIQALGKVLVDVRALDADLLSISAHKAHGPKGVGALYVKNGVELTPLIEGGGHECGLRSGTENVPGIAGFGKACDLAVQWLNQKQLDRVAALRDRLEAGIRKLVPEATLNGHPIKRLPNTLNMTLPGMRGESLVLFLDRHGVYFSSGSACKSGNPEPSHVLRAIGMTDEDAHCAVRLSLGVGNDEADIDYTLSALAQVIQESQSSVRFVGCR
jgi:cysteine desulfurase NifS